MKANHVMENVLVDLVSPGFHYVPRVCCSLRALVHAGHETNRFKAQKHTTSHTVKEGNPTLKLPSGKRTFSRDRPHVSAKEQQKLHGLFHTVSASYGGPFAVSCSLYLDACAVLASVSTRIRPFRIVQCSLQLPVAQCSNILGLFFPNFSADSMPKASCFEYFL